MNVKELCSFIPYFENINIATACCWKGGEKREDGVINMPYPVYEDNFMKFIDTFYKSDLSVGNYPDELNRRVPDWQTIDINKVIETADFDLVKVIFTKCVRVERFCDGAWAGSIESGHFLSILKRMNTLLENGEIN